MLMPFGESAPAGRRGDFAKHCLAPALVGRPRGSARGLVRGRSGACLGEFGSMFGGKRYNQINSRI